MTPDTNWLQLALYAGAAAAAVLLLQRIPYVGRIFSFLFSFGLIAACIFLLLQQAPYDPNLARITEQLGIDSQKVEGGEVRIRMSPDGHFWARVEMNGVERRMLIDSGATITTISEDTARAAAVQPGSVIAPIVLRTANGAIAARPGRIDRLRLGSIEASGVSVAISPAIGNLDVLGMNFLSDLASWRVEGRTLILVPDGADRAAEKI